MQKRFYVKKDNKFYTNWVGDSSEYWGDTADYCDASNDNKPRTDVTYLLETERGFARYRFMNDELVYCGMFTDLGFEDIPAGQIFPTAKHTATIKYKISDHRSTCPFLLCTCLTGQYGHRQIPDRTPCPVRDMAVPAMIFYSGFSTCTMAVFCMGIRQFLLLPNSTITVSSVMSMTTP